MSENDLINSRRLFGRLSYSPLILPKPGDDEPTDALGQSLRLPEWLEPRRFEIEALLPNIHAPLELRGPNA